MDRSTLQALPLKGDSGLVALLTRLAGGRLGFDPWRDPRTSTKGKLVDHLLATYPADVIADAINGAATIKPVTPKAAPKAAPKARSVAAAVGASVTSVEPDLPKGDVVVVTMPRSSLPVIADYVQRIGQKSCKDLFGLDIKLNGKPLMVDCYNDPLAPPVNPGYVFEKQRMAVILTLMTFPGANIWLGGPASAGKTTIVQEIAARTGRSFCRISMDGSVERAELLGGQGAKAGDTVFQSAIVLAGASRPGALILLDEPGQSKPEFNACLNSILEPSRQYTVQQTSEVFTCAPGVIFFAADNSLGSGDLTGEYAGVRQQNRAFMSRFTVLQFDYLPPAREARVISNMSGCNKETAEHIVHFANVCRSNANTGEISSPPTLRELSTLARLLTAGIPVKQAFAAAISDRHTAAVGESLRQLWNANVNPVTLQAALNVVEADLTGGE